MNDVLTLNLYNGEGGNAPVPWSALSPVVSQMEVLATKIALALRQSYRVWHVPEPASAPAARLLIAGPPRRGSIILPFALELPVTLNFLALEPVRPAGAPSSALTDYLGALADLAALTHFVRDLLFGSRGLVARRTDQMAPVAISGPESAAIEEAGAYLADLTPDIERLLQAAEATGCSQLEVQVNDQTAVKLIMENRRRRSALLARQNRPTWGSTEGPPNGYFFDPTDPQPMIRRSEAAVEVEYEDRALTAIMLQVTSPSSQSIVAVWDAQMELPKVGDIVEIRGKVVDRQELKPLEDVPADLEKATDVFLVQNARPSWR